MPDGSNVIWFPNRRQNRNLASVEKSVRRAAAADHAELVCKGFLRQASLLPIGPERERMTAMGHAEGAKQDMLTALCMGRLREARECLACWRALHRSAYPRQGDQA